MALFGRKQKPVSNEETQPDAPSLTTPSATGPQDSGGQPAPPGYLDFGALYVPSIPGMQLQAQFDADGVTTRRLLLVIASSGIQVSVVAAPRSGGVWPEMRQMLAASITKEGGEVETIEGRYGSELAANISVQMPDGSRRATPRTIFGIEGPRWLVRIDLQGAAAAGDRDQLAECYKIIDRLIVNRGPEARIRFDMLPLRLPEGSRAEDELT